MQNAIRICKILPEMNITTKTFLAFALLAGAAISVAVADDTMSSTNTAPSASQNSGGASNILSNDKARESYALGMYFGTGWKRNDVDVDVDMLMKGIKDAESGGQTLLTQPEMINALNQLRDSVRMNHQKAEMQEAAKNQEEGRAFLAQNKTRPGVVTLPDGLQYKIIKEGDGPTPGPDDMVTVNYRGTFVNGQEFDSSARSGHPAEFPVRGVIPGWTEGLEKMKVGSKWDLYVPSNLAYGTSGRPPAIGPDETLIFEVELLSVAPRPEPPHVQPLTSDIIKVPSAEEMKKGAKIETITPQELEKMQESATNK